VEWFPIEEAIRTLTFDNDKETVQQAKAELEEEP